MNGLDPPSDAGVCASLPSAIVDKLLGAPTWPYESFRLSERLPLARRPESWDDGRGGRGEDAKEDARFGEDAVLTDEWAMDGRGRPSERRLGVCVAIVTFFQVALDGNYRFVI